MPWGYKRSRVSEYSLKSNIDIGGMSQEEKYLIQERPFRFCY